MKKVKVFIASPGEVSEGRDVASYVVSELRRMLGSAFDIELEALRWETHAWPDVGEDAQDVINKEIEEFDIFVGVMWKRFGTPTKRDDSGTAEEFNRAFEFHKKFKRPKIMFYFCKKPFYTTNQKELTQFKKVIDFRKKLEDLGVLYWEYNTPLEFERNLREHLIRQILEVSENGKQESDNVSAKKTTSKKAPMKLNSRQPLNIFLSYVHSDRERVREVYKDLRYAGHRPWIDESNLLPGQMIHEEIRKAVSSADVMLVFVSKNSSEKASYFNEELKYMYEQERKSKLKRSRIIPVRLDSVTPPGSLKKFLWIDLFNPQAMEDLLKTLEKISIEQNA